MVNGLSKMYVIFATFGHSNINTHADIHGKHIHNTGYGLSKMYKSLTFNGLIYTHFHSHLSLIHIY